MLKPPIYLVRIFLDICNLRSWRSLDSGETSVWAPYWILAEERLRKSEKVTKRWGAGRNSFRYKFSPAPLPFVAPLRRPPATQAQFVVIRVPSRPSTVFSSGNYSSWSSNLVNLVPGCKQKTRKSLRPLRTSTMCMSCGHVN